MRFLSSATNLELCKTCLEHPLKYILTYTYLDADFSVIFVQLAGVFFFFFIINILV